MKTPTLTKNPGETGDAPGARGLYVETYGCQMNEYDSGLARRLLGEDGYAGVERPEDAGVILINTCAIREKAHEKVYHRLQSLAHLKRRDPALIIGVLGCMAQNLGDDLFAQGLPVDFVLGPDNYRELPRLIRRIRAGGDARVNITQLSRTETYEDLEPEVVSGRLAFVTIMRGCDNFCSFCVVPYTRGRERSRSPRSIVGEIDRLTARHGVREVTLFGQNVNSYFCEDLDFTGLVRLILDDTDIERVRFTSPHPHDFPQSLLELMAGEKRFCSQIHLPAQSGSSSVLERMKRDYTRAQYIALLHRIRSIVPDAGLSTDVIVGFCGETDAEFDDTLSLMEEARFDMAFMFRYSDREHTLAHKQFRDDVPESVKIARLERLIAGQTAIMREKNAACAGKTYDIMIEGRSRRRADHWMGRTDTGKVVIFPALAAGEGDDSTDGLDRYIGICARVRITGSTSATLHGEAIKDYGRTGEFQGMLVS